MKRGILTILTIIILILPLVSATISVDGPERTDYNIGDDIEIAGYIWAEQKVDGFLSMNIVCANLEYPLQLVPLDLEPEQQIIFPDELDWPQITIPPNMIGECWVDLTVKEGQETIESTSSASFNVVKTLEGHFNIEEVKVQVGNELNMHGNVFQLDNDPVNGVAEIYFKHNYTKYLIDVIDIEDGEFDFSHKTTATPAGAYKIDISVRDTYGNEMLFSEVATFLLIKKLDVSANTDKREYLPGDKIKIDGDVADVQLDKVMSANVEILLGDHKFETALVDGEFSYEFDIPKDIKTGKHTIALIVKDKLGNVGGEQIKIEIKGVSSALQNEISADFLEPLEVLEVTAVLYDQAGDLQNENIIIEIFDPKDEPRLSKTVQSNQKLLFRVPKYAQPGVWTIKSSTTELEAENIFTVSIMTTLDVDLDKETLNVLNSGNTKYKGGIEVSLTNNVDTFKIKSRKSLYPNDTLTILLNNEVPSGTYDVTVTLANGKKEHFEDVVIQGGKPLRSFNGIYLLLIFVFIVLILYTSMSSKPKQRRRSVPRRNKKKLANLRKNVEHKKRAEDEKKKNILDFKNRILDEIKRTEAQSEQAIKSKRGSLYSASYKEEPAKEKPKEENKGGFANMFG